MYGVKALKSWLVINVKAFSTVPARQIHHIFVSELLLYQKYHIIDLTHTGAEVHRFTSI